MDGHEINTLLNQQQQNQPKNMGSLHSHRTDKQQQNFLSFQQNKFKQ